MLCQIEYQIITRKSSFFRGARPHKIMTVTIKSPKIKNNTFLKSVPEGILKSLNSILPYFEA